MHANTVHNLARTQWLELSGKWQQLRWKPPHPFQTTANLALAENTCGCQGSQQRSCCKSISYMYFDAIYVLRCNMVMILMKGRYGLSWKTVNDLDRTVNLIGGLVHLKYRTHTNRLVLEDWNTGFTCIIWSAVGGQQTYASRKNLKKTVCFSAGISKQIYEKSQIFIYF